jgi:hypothetical protein
MAQSTKGSGTRTKGKGGGRVDNARAEAVSAVEGTRPARHLLARGRAPVDLAGAADAVQPGVKPNA